MESKFKIVFLAVNDEYSGCMQKYIYEKHPDWVIGSVISKNAIYKKNKFQAVLFVINKSGLYYLVQMIKIKILKLFFSKEKKETALSLANAHNKEVYYSGNINSEADIEKLKSWDPDLIISTNFSHYVGKNVREITKHGAWNLHKSYLPSYRGMAPSFFALLEGAKNVGVTLHIIDKGFDTGSIIIQKKLSVEKADTVYSLNWKTADSGGKMLLEYLENLNLDELTSHSQPSDIDKYYTYPSKAEIMAFRKKGLHFDQV